MEIYEYMDVPFGVISDEFTNKSMLSFLKDYFYVSKQESKPLFSVELLPVDYKNLKSILEHGQKLPILSGTRPGFKEMGMSLDAGMIRYIYNLVTKGVYCVNYLADKVTIFNKDRAMLVKDGKRVLRDLVKVSVEKEKRAIMYHSAAIKGKNNQGIILMGNKESGKTPISLKLIYEYGFSEISRDKIFLVKQGDHFVFYGWPTHYNLTVRTLKSFKETKKFFKKEYETLSDQELDNIREKIQLLPWDMGIDKKVRHCELTHVVFIVNKKAEYDPLDLLAHNCLSPKDPLYADWHQWVQDKTSVYQRAREISRELMNFKKIIVLEREQKLDQTIKKLLNWLE